MRHKVESSSSSSRFSPLAELIVSSIVSCRIDLADLVDCLERPERSDRTLDLFDSAFLARDFGDFEFHGLSSTFSEVRGLDADRFGDFCRESRLDLDFDLDLED
jgi:hypothetical protein